jgi:class 3 adenylate cyclase
VPNIIFNYSQTVANPIQYGPGVTFNALSPEEFATFNPSVLGLGDISREGENTQALAAFFDLEGFTGFCGQVDSHLVIPEFLTRYLNWLFHTLAAEFCESNDGTTVRLWGCLPFYAKFLGDGILFLWATERCRGLPGKVNIAQSLLAITNAYVGQFLVDIRKAVSNPPRRLRCGIALGQITSLGGGSDYVGSCINVASRLQKLGNLSFAVSRRGFDLCESPDLEGSLRSYLTLKKTAIRSIGQNELVYIRKDEFAALGASEKQIFIDP